MVATGRKQKRSKSPEKKSDPMKDKTAKKIPDVMEEEKTKSKYA